jgi:mRNA interferase MazF
MSNFIKNFVDWFKLKTDLNNHDYNPPLTKERELWWCSVGENIGTEISGKGTKFNRPVIIFKKLSKYTFFVIPTSTQIKEGSWFVPFVRNGKSMMACLHQARIVDYRRLDDRIGVMSSHDYELVKKGFASLYIGN